MSSFSLLKKMKIAHVVCTFPPYHGGIGNVAYHFACINERSGHQVTVFTPLYPELENKICQYSEPLKMDICRLPPTLRYGSGAVLPQVLWKLLNFDLIILHYPFFGTAEISYFYRLLNKERNRFLVHYHMDVLGLRPFGKLLSIPCLILLASLLKKADAITCASLDYIRQSRIANFYKRYPDKFIEIPFGVDIERFHPLPQERVQDKSEKIILFVGGLDRAHYFKGVDVLIRAAAALPKEVGKWVLHIVGDGDLRKSYQNLAKSLEISDQVYFLGSAKDETLPDIYRNADIFVLPSINSNEAFGLVLLEAMASGVPVITSSLPGVRTVFNNGREGLLTEPGNVNALVKKITKMLMDDTLRIGMGLKARRHVAKSFSLESVRRGMETALNKVAIDR